MKEFDKIYLSWRKGQGSRRHIVGILQQTPDGRFEFSYDAAAVEKAKEDGFTPYTEFPDIIESYNGNVLDIFAQRLIKSERPDIQNFYDFWEIEPQHKDDKFYMLGHTQGLQPTDNFEFLADYNPVKGLHFLTELAGLSTYKLPSGTLKEGDELRFEFDKANEYDSNAVTVFKGDIELGHIKKIHCKVFHKAGAEKLKLTVKSVDKNGIIKKAFIKVSL
jgi:HIRAN domain